MHYLNRRPPLLPGFLLLSMLLHLLLLQWMPQGLFQHTQPKEPVVVEIRPPRPVPPPRERELEIPPEPDQKRETPARRLGPSDRVVEKERAPAGDMPEERRAARRTTASRRPPVAPPRPKAKAEEIQPRSSAREKFTPREDGPSAPSSAPQANVPDLKTLLQLPETTVARLESEWRVKYRSDVEKGDAVWLDTEKDILISFFQRFKNNIYGVWNYPLRARDRGEEGTCLLRITINRDGTLANVGLMESSGSSDLDQAAMAAVRKGSPFGPLPRAYEEESLSIFAFFNYSLTRRVIY